MPEALWQLGEHVHALQNLSRELQALPDTGRQKRRRAREIHYTVAGQMRIYLQQQMRRMQPIHSLF
jgi:hypothetical protein